MNRRMRMIGVLGAVTTVALGAALWLRGDRHRGRAEFPSPDPWYRLPPSEFFLSGEAKERAPATFAEVLPEAESLARLERSPWAEVSEQEAVGLVGRPIGGSGGRLVLVRALAWDTPYGGFTVRWRSGEVFVQHGCLGARPLPVVRRAVVARLPDLPSEVYVGLEMAQ